jgi:hypothetical protein
VSIDATCTGHLMAMVALAMLASAWSPPTVHMPVVVLAHT